MYGLEEEDPCELMQEFSENTTDTIYVCRYLAAPKNGVYILRGAVVNQIEISDDETEELAASQSKEDTNQSIVSNGTPRIYTVTEVDNSDTNIKLSVKRTNTKQNAVTNTQNSSAVTHTTNTTPVISRKYDVTVPEDSNSLKLRFVRKKALNNSATDSDSDVEIVSVTKTINKSVSNTAISPSSLLNSLTITDKETVTKSPDHSPSSLIKSISLNDNVQVETTQTPTVKSSAAMKTDNRQTVNRRRVSFSDGKENAGAGSVNYETNLVVQLEKLNPNVAKLQRIEETPVEMDTEIRSRLRISTRRASQHQTNDSLTPVRKSLRQTPRVSYREADIILSSLRQSYADADILSPLRRSSRQKNVKQYDDYVLPKVRKEETPPMTPVNEDVVKSARSKAKRTTSAVRDEPMMTTPKKQLRVIGTPKSTRILVKNLTPAIEERDEMMDVCGTPMQRARAGLSFYKLPAKTPCRENEYMNIYTFVSGRLRDQTSGCVIVFKMTQVH